MAGFPHGNGHGDVSASLTAAEVMTRLGISPRTLARWQAEGLLAPITPPGKRRRFDAETVERLRQAPPEPTELPAP